MKNFKKFVSFVFIFLFVLVGTLTACKSQSVSQPTFTETTNTIKTKEIIRDTVFEIKKDSSFYKALLECRNGAIIIKPNSINSSQGNSLKKPIVNIQDNILKVDCEAEAQKLLAQWKESHTTENLQTKVLKTIYVEKKLSKWQNAQIWLGRLLILIIIFYTGRFLFKIFKPI